MNEWTKLVTGAAVIGSGLLFLSNFSSRDGTDKSTTEGSEDNTLQFSNEIVFFVNGKRIVEKNVDPRIKLITYLREHVNITSPKQGCNKGVCGACTVMISSYDLQRRLINHRAVNACLVPLCDVHNKAIITVEGLGTVRGGFHPIQERFAVTHASQCGFCTPGMVMAFYALLRNTPNPTSQQIMDNLDGNLCRCTGYRPIFDAMKSFASDGCCGSGGCSSCPKKVPEGMQVECSVGLRSLGELKPLEFDSELIFPPSLKDPPTPLHIQKENHHWYAPTSLETFLKIMKQNHVNIIAGDGNSQLSQGGIFVSTKHVPELTQIHHSKNSGVTVGAAVTLQDLKTFLESINDSSLAYEAISHQLARLANTQIRNSSTVGGNIVSHEWHSDLLVALMAADASATVIDLDGLKRSTPISAINFRGSELLLSIYIPKSKPYTFIRTYKFAPREQTSRATISAGCRVTIQNDRVIDSCFAFSGVSDIPKRALDTEEFVKNKIWAPELIPHVVVELHREFDEEISKHPESQYRNSLLESIFFMFFHSAYAYFGNETDEFAENPHPIGHSLQSFPVDRTSPAFTGKPVMHMAGDLHTSGDAVFLDDMIVHNLLHSYFITSTKAHANIIAIDDTKARAMPGVHKIFYAKDVPGNRAGDFDGEWVFAEKEIEYYAQPIGLVVADTAEQAKAAAKAVEVQYEELPVINTIEDAVKANSFIHLPPTFFPEIYEIGDVEKGFEKSDLVIEGEISVGGAEHWYMEPHVHLAIPGERDELIVWATTQLPSTTNAEVAKALKIDASKINTNVKRIGGGFGGKGSVHHTAAVALATKILNRPVKLFVERELDLLITGKRCYSTAKYKIGVSRAGKINAVDIFVYQNSGCSMGVSGYILTQTLKSIGCVYDIPNLRSSGKLCKTNRVSSCAVRGAGKPQGCAIMETILEHTCTKLNISPHIFRELNFAKPGSVTHFHQTYKPEQILVREIYDQVKTESNFEKRLKDVEEFNQKNHYKKRAVTILPTRYVHYSSSTRNFARTAATVSLLTDGSVILLHGGIEMGQGLHTKVQQLCATCLGVPFEKVYTPSNTTNNSANAAPTVGSMGTDLFGSAVMNACDILNKRLQPYKEKMVGKSFAEICSAAHNSGENLNAIGYHIWDHWCKPGEHNFLYFSWNCGVVEVELDLLTGKFKILEASCWQDVGQSVNPTVDIGQIEGALVQGFGWLTLEDLESNYTPDGVLHINAENYAIPTFKNMPSSMNVTLIPNSTNPSVAHSSKGIGEPPYLFGTALVLALRQAIAAARKEHNLEPWVKLDYPATSAKLKAALGDVHMYLMQSSNASKGPTKKIKVY